MYQYSQVKSVFFYIHIFCEINFIKIQTPGKLQFNQTWIAMLAHYHVWCRGPLVLGLPQLAAMVVAKQRERI